MISLLFLKESSIATCSEVTVGSGFYLPHSFNHIEGEPACGFALRVTRHPEKHIYVCQGGGYISSGGFCFVASCQSFLLSQKKKKQGNQKLLRLNFQKNAISQQMKELVKFKHPSITKEEI